MKGEESYFQKGRNNNSLEDVRELRERASSSSMEGYAFVCIAISGFAKSFKARWQGATKTEQVEIQSAETSVSLFRFTTILFETYQ